MIFWTTLLMAILASPGNVHAEFIVPDGNIFIEQGGNGYSFVDDTTTGIIGVSSTLRFKTNGADDRLFIASDGKVGIGTLIPGTLLEVLGGTITVPAGGNAGGPEYSFFQDTDTGFFQPAANELGMATGGSERLRIDSSGNVGIGTASPCSTCTLHVSGDIYLEGSAPLLEIDGGSTIGQLTLSGVNGHFSFVDQGTERALLNTDSNYLHFYGRDSQPMLFQDTGGNNWLFLEDGGNVGIGTTNPGAQLELSNSNSGVDFVVNSTTFTVKDGRIGIGTSNPSTPVHITRPPEGTIGMWYIPTSVSEGDSLFIGQVPSFTGNNIWGATFVGDIEAQFGVKIQNSDTDTTSSGAFYQALVIDAGGDAWYDAAVNGVEVWAFGVDNSDSEKFKIANSGQSDRFSRHVALTIDSASYVGIGTESPSVTFQVGASTLAVTNGKVGIGTTNPTSLLDLSGTSPGLKLTETGGGDPQIELDDGAGADWLLSNSGGDFTVIEQGVNTWLRIDDNGNGNVGFGGDGSPDAQLEILSRSASDGYILAISSQNDVTGNILAVTGEGNIGVGTASPASELEVAGAVTVDSMTVIGASVTINGVAYLWPSSDGSVGETLTTDGAGNLSWDPTSSSGAVLTATQTFSGYNIFAGSVTFTTRLSTQGFIPQGAFTEETSFNGCTISGSTLSFHLPGTSDVRFIYQGDTENGGTQNENFLSLLLDGDFLTGYDSDTPIANYSTPNGGQPVNAYFSRVEEDVAAGEHFFCLAFWVNSGRLTIQRNSTDARAQLRAEPAR